MALANILFYFVFPALIALYLFLKKKYAYFAERNIPHIKPSSLLMGNFGEVGKSYHRADFMRNLYNKCKDKIGICGYFTMFVPSIVITDLELVKLVTVRDFNYFTDRGLYINEEREPITGNLFLIGGDKWRYIRNKLSPAFTSGRTKSMFHSISDRGNTLIEALEKSATGQSVDIRDITSRFTIDVISSCAFGFNANTLVNDNSEMIYILEKTLGEDGCSPFKFFFLANFPRFARFFKIRFFENKVNDYFVKILGGSMKYRESNNVVRNDFLNMLIQMKNEDSFDGENLRKMTELECVGQAFVFFIGGADTSSSAIAFTMLELGFHLDIQDKLRKEIIEKTEASNGEITYDNLHEMTYLNQVVNETLRKFPPSPFAFRQAIADYKVPNTNIIIEKGTHVMIPTIAFHYDEEYWTEPEEFKPERFSPEETAKRPNLSFLPFGNGPRNCIGLKFGQITTLFAVATIVKHFKVTLDLEKTRLPLSLDPKKFNLEPKGGSWVKLEKI